LKQPKGTSRNHLGNDTKKMMDFVFGRDASKAMQREEAALRKERVATCELCRQTEDEGVKFMICKACKENLDRRVFYCSV
jgi:predicted SprT family Zn-dependent metalloprotease